MKAPIALLVSAAFVSGCSTNPVTGRGQMVGFPAAQVHADIGFALSSSARRVVDAEPCADECEKQLQDFQAQVKRMGAELETAARAMSPDLFERISAFDMGVDHELGISTASSASGRIALGKGLAALSPEEDLTAFLIAREMAHVIARHDEEDAGARIMFSALTALLPFTLIARVIASTLGSGALMGSWAEQQRKEADEIALALLLRTGRSPGTVARALTAGLRKDLLPDGDWTTRYRESTARITAVVGDEPKVADFDEWLTRESVRSIERISACSRLASSDGQSSDSVADLRRECGAEAA